jgi:indolepyruvate ferredoxin oxidoreductase alpha subunit
MKPMGDMLLRQEAFSEIVMGNTALVRAMVEAGTRVIASYPGSPTPEIAQAISSIPDDRRPFYFEFSTNEKVATEVAYGTAVNGHLSTVFFKSVGLNVASDTFVQLGLMNIIGGMIIVLGDDPGANSSQNEQDNRHYARLSYIPVLEPASPDEVYSFYRLAVSLSKDRGMPVILRLTTHVCHAKQRVSFPAWTPKEPDRTSRFDPANGPYVPIAAEVFPMKHRALQRISEMAAWSNASGIHTHIQNGHPTHGIITAGLPFLSVMDAMETAPEKPDILKLGMIYPLPNQLIADFLQAHSRVKVLEELDDILEKDIRALAHDKQIPTRITGKCDVEDWIGEYTPDRVYDMLAKTWPELFPPKAAARPVSSALPPRPPQMCPGCGHRSAFHAIKKALGQSDITVADIGCHTLGYLPPYRVGQLLMCMGASPGMAAGLSLFNDSRNVICFLGDSTFFHAGIPGIINALFNRHNISLVLMENGATAMTGHQDHAGSGKNFNEVVDRIPIRRVLEGLGVKHIFEIDTYKQAGLTDLIRQAVDIKEFSVVIARHPCMLKFIRQQRKKPGYISRKVSIDQNRCQRIHDCVERFGCPTFTRDSNGRVDINADLCIGDGSCIQTCPADAILKPA